MLDALLIFLMLSSGITASVLNKYIVTNLQITAKFFILSIQTLSLILLLSFLDILLFRSISFSMLFLTEVTDWIIPAGSLVIMIYSGLEANARLSISLFTVLKNLTIPVIAAYDILFNSYIVTPFTLISFFLILLSSFLGAYASDKKKRDSLSLLGLLWMSVNCLSSAAYIIRSNAIIRSKNVSSIFAAWAVNVLASPLIFLCFLVEGVESVKLVKARELLIIGLSGGAASFIAVANAQAAHTFSTTTVAVINALNKLPIAVSGVVFGFESTGKSCKWIAVLLGIISSILYATSRIPEKQ